MFESIMMGRKPAIYRIFRRPYPRLITSSNYGLRYTRPYREKTVLLYQRSEYFESRSHVQAKSRSSQSAGCEKFSSLNLCKLHGLTESFSRVALSIRSRSSSLTSTVAVRGLLPHFRNLHREQIL